MSVCYIVDGRASYVDAVGLDISKVDFYACALQRAGRFQKCFPNSAAGYRQFRAWLRELRCHKVHVCMEATGAYWLDLATALHAAGVAVSVVNPSRTALFARSQLRRTKTDVVDAAMLADFCATQRPAAWTPPAPEVLELRALLAYREHIVDEKRRFGQLARTLHLSKGLKRLHERQITTLKQMLGEIEEQMQSIVVAHEPLRAAVRELETVKGFGFVTSAALVAKLPVGRLRDGKAAGAYVGLTPRDRQSGTSIHGKVRICKTGNASLRHDLYMAAISAKRHNPILRSFAQRLQDKGKPPKVVTVAVMRKLAVLAYTIIKRVTEKTPIAA